MPLPNPFIQTGIGGGAGTATGVASITSGLIDGTTIGASTPAPGTFTTIGSLAGNMLWGAHQSNAGAPTAGGSSGFAAGDTFVLAGGTFTRAASGTVDAVSSGVIIEYHITDTGVYTQPPAQPMGISSTSGSGLGSPTFTLTFGPLASDILFPPFVSGGVNGEMALGYQAGLGRKGIALGNTLVGFRSGGAGGNTGDGMGGGTGISGGETTAIGWNAGTQLTTGQWWTLMGVNAGGHETTGSFGVLIGTDSGKWLNNSSHVVGVGAGSVAYLQNPQFIVAIGRNAAAGNIIAKSVTGVADNGSGLYRIAVASSANMATGDTVVITGALGQTALNAVWSNVTVIDGTHFDLAGSTYASGYTSGATMNVFTSTKLQQVVAVGYGALSAAGLRSSGGLVAVGTSALSALTTGTAICAVGDGVAGALTTGTQHAIYGSGAGATITTANGSSIFGYKADVTGTGAAEVVAIGGSSLGGGHGALAGDKSVVIGARGGNSSLTGSNNTLIGYSVAASLLTTHTGTIIIGVSSNADIAASHSLLIQGNGTTPAISGSALNGTPIINFPGAKITIGASGLPTITSGAGAPSATEPNGSLYARTDGSVNTRLYVSQGGGVWSAVASL